MTKHARIKNTNGSASKPTNAVLSKDGLDAIQTTKINEALTAYRRGRDDEEPHICYFALNAGWKFAGDSDSRTRFSSLIGSTHILRAGLTAWYQAQVRGCEARLNKHFTLVDPNSRSNGEWKSYLKIPHFAYLAEREYILETAEAHRILLELVNEIQRTAQLIAELPVEREELFDLPDWPEPRCPRHFEVLFWYLATYWSDWASLLQHVAERQHSDTVRVVLSSNTFVPITKEFEDLFSLCLKRLPEVDSHKYCPDKDEWQEWGWIKGADYKRERQKWRRAVIDPHHPPLLPLVLVRAVLVRVNLRQTLEAQTEQVFELLGDRDERVAGEDNPHGIAVLTLRDVLKQRRPVRPVGREVPEEDLEMTGAPRLRPIWKVEELFALDRQLSDELRGTLDLVDEFQEDAMSLGRLQNVFALGKIREVGNLEIRFPLPIRPRVRIHEREVLVKASFTTADLRLVPGGEPGTQDVRRTDEAGEPGARVGVARELPPRVEREVADVGFLVVATAAVGRQRFVDLGGLDGIETVLRQDGVGRLGSRPVGVLDPSMFGHGGVWVGGGKSERQGCDRLVVFHPPAYAYRCVCWHGVHMSQSHTP